MTLRDSARMQKGFSAQAVLNQAAEMLLRGNSIRAVVQWLRSNPLVGGVQCWLPSLTWTEMTRVPAGDVLIGVSE